MPILGSTEQRDLIWRKRQEKRIDASEPDPERVLLNYLRQGYHDDTPVQLNGRDASATGRVLRDCVVSRLEVANALAMLPDPERRCVEAWFVGNRSRKTARLHLGLDDRAMHVLAHNGLRAMVRRIFEHAWFGAGDVGMVA